MKISLTKQFIPYAYPSSIHRMAAIAAALALGFGSEHALAQRPLGVDVSSYQGHPTWSSVKGAGVAFAWAKATEGTTITDADFTYNASNGKAAGVYMGAYHFAHPNSATPGSEASHFWGVAGPLHQGRRQDPHAHARHGGVQRRGRRQQLLRLGQPMVQ